MESLPMWVKICGIRDVSTARMVADCRPDAIGLNFYSASPRYVEPEAAKEICRAVPEMLDVVGVFVNPPLCEIATIAYAARLDFAQLHGDEPPEFLKEIHETLPDVRLIRAWRMGSEGLDEWALYFEKCRSLGVPIAGCLLDARVEGMYGGSGKTVAWDVVSREYQVGIWPPLILAGGLSAHNISQAIQTVHPYGVDVASGVERQAAVKDPEMVRDFIAKARSAPK